jgi:F0F1-type ATP synthase delta subunit
MKKNKQLDKVVDQSLRSVIKGDKLDQSKVISLVTAFKKLPFSQAVYALTAFKKGLTNFEEKHTLTISAPVELSKETMNKIKNAYNSKLEISNLKFNLDSSLLAGFKFKIGDTIFDSSLRGSLEALKK